MKLVQIAPIDIKEINNGILRIALLLTLNVGLVYLLIKKYVIQQVIKINMKKTDGIWHNIETKIPITKGIKILSMGIFVIEFINDSIYLVL